MTRVRAWEPAADDLAPPVANTGTVWTWGEVGAENKGLKLSILKKSLKAKFGRG